MADISFTTTAVQFTDAESFLTTNRTAGTTLAAGDFVVLDSANQWILGDVNSGTLEVTGSNGFGIALNPAALNQPVKVVTEDGAEIDFGSGLAQWDTYIGSANPGKIAEIADLATGHYTVLLGYAKTTSILVTKFLRVPGTHP